MITEQKDKRKRPTGVSSQLFGGSPVLKEHEVVFLCDRSQLLNAFHGKVLEDVHMSFEHTDVWSYLLRHLKSTRVTYCVNTTIILAK